MTGDEQLSFGADEDPGEKSTRTDTHTQQVIERSRPLTLVTSRRMSPPAIGDVSRGSTADDQTAATDTRPATPGPVSGFDRDVSDGVHDVDDASRNRLPPTVSLETGQEAETPPQEVGRESELRVSDSHESGTRGLSLVYRDESDSSGMAPEAGTGDAVQRSQRGLAVSEAPEAIESVDRSHSRRGHSGDDQAEGSQSRGQESDVISPSSARAVSGAEAPSDPLAGVEMSRFVDRLYREIERKDRIERERRGL